MLIILGIILFILSDIEMASAIDWENSERNAEIRHQELMKTINEKEKKQVEKHKAVRKRAIKDSYGNVLVEEVILEGRF